MKIPPPEQSESWYHNARERMVHEQIELRGIRDREVLRAMREVSRHRFVPEAIREEAYEDTPLYIGFHQTISQPYIVAYMIEQLKLLTSDRVLEIGLGSGYQAAVLSRLVSEVYAIEVIPELERSASLILTELGYTNVQTRCGNGWEGWQEHAPYDAIIAAAAADKLPAKLVEQLAEGGRMIIPIGDDRMTQSLHYFEKQAGSVVEKKGIGVMFVPLIHPSW